MWKESAKKAFDSIERIYVAKIHERIFGKWGVDAFALTARNCVGAFAVSFVLGASLWFCLTSGFEKKRETAIKSAPSPFQMALMGTPYDPRSASTNRLDDLQAKQFLVAALRQIGLRNPDGRPLPEDELQKLANLVLLSLKESPREVFSLSGTRTVVRLILYNSITSLNSTNAGEVEAQWEKELIGWLEQRQAIVRSSEFLDALVRKKEIPIDTISKAAAGDSNIAEVRDWPMVYQLALRSLQRVQNDAHIRNARFYVTFVEGVDVLGMFILAWFIIVLLGLRFLRARGERKTSIDNNEISEEIDALETDLKNSAFRNLTRQLEKLAKAKKDKSPIFHGMLEIVKNELEIKKNESKPDALLVWTQSLREEVASSRWLLAWCGRALPTIGFIFKVYGIALAMKDSDTIALANGALDQAAAISNVSGALGLAFSATFVAFFLSLSVGLFEAWEAHYERQTIADLESSLVRLLTVPPAGASHA